MSPVLDPICDALGAEGLDLTRAIPRDADHLLLDLSVTSTGQTLAGQWFADTARTAQTAWTTSALSGAANVRLVGTNVVVQAAGADRRLSALHALSGGPGATLVAHQPERQGVVRHLLDDRFVFTKVVRPERLPVLATGLRTVSRSTRIRIPTVCAEDDSVGALTTEALPGTSLHKMLADPQSSEDRLHHVGEAAGRMLRELHAAPVSPWVVRHDAAAEAAVLRRWLALASRFEVNPLPVARRAERLRHAEALLARTRPPGPRLLHGHLHDKQLVVDGDELGVLGLETVTAGDPALDLASLLVHLETRALEGYTTATRVDACARGVLSGYQPDPAVMSSLPAYLLSARLRLLAADAFRPRLAGAVGLEADALAHGNDSTVLSRGA